MSANHVHMINPSAIRHKSVGLLEDSHTYSVVSVSPLIISNDDLVTVVFNTSTPAETDWIGAYSPPTVDVTKTAPVKWGYCGAPSSSNYLQTGLGQLAFNMTNLREGIKFYYFKGDVRQPEVVASSNDIVHFANRNQPLRNRVVATGDPNVLSLLWSSAVSTQPVLKWGTRPGAYDYTVPAVTTTVRNDTLCGGVAVGVGWRELGLIHTANITGILELNLSSSNISYIFGDAATDDFSEEFSLLVPPRAGVQPPTRPTTLALYADMGVGSSDNSYDTTVFEEQCPPATNTSYSVGDLALRGEIDAVFHSGDISYANGYLSGWDFFMDQISPISGRVVYLTTVGNHESDWPGTASIPGYGVSSGGECGVVTLQMLPMPAPATTDQPWWSYDVGLFHVVGMSTEHDFSKGSPQYFWIEQDLRSVNRSVTPWVLFSGHRSMYVDSNFCCPLGGLEECTAAGEACVPGWDVEVMQALQASIEPLLRQYRVNLAFAGHFHSVERQSAVYQNQVVQAAVKEVDGEGNTWWVHDNPAATVWMVVGTAGNGPNNALMNYTWSEKYWNSLWGYALVSAVNATHLEWKYIDSSNDQVVDRVRITQDFASWLSDRDGGSDGGGGAGWGSLSAAAQGGIMFAIVFVGLCLLAGLAFFLRSRLASRPAGSSAQAGQSTTTTQSPMQGTAASSAHVELQDVA